MKGVSNDGISDLLRRGHYAVRVGSVDCFCKDDHIPIKEDMLGEKLSINLTDDMRRYNVEAVGTHRVVKLFDN